MGGCGNPWDKGIWGLMGQGDVGECGNLWGRGGVGISGVQGGAVGNSLSPPVLQICSCFLCQSQRLKVQG